MIRLIKIWISCFYEFLSRYKFIIGSSWKSRNNDAHSWNQEQTEFLPAALALQHEPVSPLPRRILFAIITLIVLLFLWSVFGRIDIIAIGQGKVVPDGRTKVIQSLETARVVAIEVKDGQHVKTGDLLIQLDSEAQRAEVERLNYAWLNTALTIAHNEEMIRCVNDTTHPPSLKLSVSLPEDYILNESLLDNAEQLIRAECREFSVGIEKIAIKESLSDKELRTLNASIKKLNVLRNISQTRLADYGRLLKMKYVSNHEYLNMKKEAAELDGELEIQKRKRSELTENIILARHERDELKASLLKKSYAQINEQKNMLNTIQNDMVKARTVKTHTTITSPVDGIVQQLAIHTIGGIVPSAQPLMSVVPDDEGLEIEANILNKDIGFVYVGQKVSVKVDTYDYTRYGTLEGRVESVSQDAVNDADSGLVYPVRIKVDNVGSSREKLTLKPGMASKVEIKIGERRIIQYFLSVFYDHIDESLRER